MRMDKIDASLTFRIMKEGAPTSPLIIGGVGGGGTRVYRALAQAAGYNMLVAPPLIRKPHWHDNWPLRKFFYPKWVTPYLKNDLGPFGKFRMRTACRMWLWLCSPLSYNSKKIKWGWKNPNTMFLLPFFKELYPNMRFIHVVRDGRDHAFHPRFPYIKHHNRLLYTDAELQLDDCVRKAIFWARCNTLIEHNVVTHLRRDQYLLSRFEDLCVCTPEEVRRIFAFLGSTDSRLVATAASLVQTPVSYNRWRSEPAARIHAVEHAIRNDLSRYGYSLTTTDA